MGYEIKVYMGEVSRFPSDDLPYFQVAAMVDLCKPGYNTEVIKLCPSSSELNTKKLEEYPYIYFYSDDGDTKVIEDRYGSRLRAIPAQKVLDALRIDWEASKKDFDPPNGYRRFYMAIPVLERFIETFDSPMCFLFGY